MSETQKTTKDLAGVFDDLVDTLRTIVKGGEIEIVTDKESGEKVAVKKTISPAMANVVRQLLRDNNITATTAHKGLKDLAQSSATRLPFTVDEDGNERPTVQ